MAKACNIQKMRDDLDTLLESTQAKIGGDAPKLFEDTVGMITKMSSGNPVVAAWATMTKKKASGDTTLEFMKHTAISSELAKVDTSKISKAEDGLWVMRNGTPNFGNPFYTKESKNQRPGDMPVPIIRGVDSNSYASTLYYRWLKDGSVPEGADKAVLDKRRDIILNNLELVRDYKTLLYNGTAAGKQINHVTALIKIANDTVGVNAAPTLTAKVNKKNTANQPIGNTYEVSTAGDSRFSALAARFKDGRTVEEAYQLDVKGYREGPRDTDWFKGKGKPPKDTSLDLQIEYTKLWEQYFSENPDLFSEISSIVNSGKKLTDKFASKNGVNQADTIQAIVEKRKDLAATKERNTPEFDKLPSYVEGQRNMVYAGIGSRNTPIEIQEQMNEAAKYLEEKGYKLRSGGALGADKAFEGTSQPWAKDGDKVTQWSAYKHKVKHTNKEVYKGGDATETTRAIAREVHESDNLKEGFALDMHARNTNQVFGANLDTPVDFVLAWTPLNAKGEVVTHADQRYYGGKGNPNNTGGTGQAIAYASLKGIPVINMADTNWRNQLDAVVAATGNTIDATKTSRVTIAGNVIEFTSTPRDHNQPLAGTSSKGIRLQEGLTADEVVEYLLNDEAANPKLKGIKATKRVVTASMNAKYDIDFHSILKGMDTSTVRKFLLLHEYRHQQQANKRDTWAEFTTNYNKNPESFEEDANVWALKQLGLLGKKAPVSTAVTEEALVVPVAAIKPKRPRIDEMMYLREIVEALQDNVYIFGDNTDDRTITKYVPTTTQAVIRGLPNTIGIDTKRDRGTGVDSYFKDTDIAEYEEYLASVREDIDKVIASGKQLVLPASGIGTGKAKLKETPKIYNALASMLNDVAGKEYMPLIPSKPAPTGRYILQGKFEANEGQKAVIDAAVDMISHNKPGIDNNVMIIQGKGGTGKSTTIGRAIELAHGDTPGKVTMAGMTFTHAAKDVLKDMTRTMKGPSFSIGTFSSMLGLRFPSSVVVSKNAPSLPLTSHNSLYSTTSSGKPPKIMKIIDGAVGGFSVTAMKDKLVIVVDESSMIPNKDYEMLLDLVNMYEGQIKLVLMGDYHQMPPINGDYMHRSPLAANPYKLSPSSLITLGAQSSGIPALAALESKIPVKVITEQQRQKVGSGVYTAITKASNLVDKVLGVAPESTAEMKEDGTLEFLNTRQLPKVVQKLFSKESFKDSKYINFNNKNVGKFNKKVREVIFGEDASKEFVEGSEQIILYDNGDTQNDYTNGLQLTVDEVTDVPAPKGRIELKDTGLGFSYKKDREYQRVEMLGANYKSYSIVIPKGLISRVLSIVAGDETYTPSHTNGLGQPVNASTDVKEIYTHLMIEAMDIHKIGKAEVYSKGPRSLHEDVFEELRNNENAFVPFTYAYGITTYKSQGQTIKNVLYDADNTVMGGEFGKATELYTALSRAKEKLYIIGDPSILDSAQPPSITEILPRGIETFNDIQSTGEIGGFTEYQYEENLDYSDNPFSNEETYIPEDVLNNSDIITPNNQQMAGIEGKAKLEPNCK